MVTIEQKVLLFSKLIDQMMSNQYREGLKNIESEYAEKLEKNRLTTDEEVKAIIDSAKKKRDIEESKINSSIKMAEKKDYMLAREKCFDKLMKSLIAHINGFVKSKDYEKYLLKLVDKLKSETNRLKSITVYVTKEDYNKYKNTIISRFNDSGYIGENINLVITKDNIIGGLILEDNIDKLRLDLSIKSLVDDNRMLIMQMLFEALEAGEGNE